MSTIAQQARIIPYVISNTAGQKATIPGTNDHTDGTWIATDVYPGEGLLNLTDSALYIRTTGGIKTLQINVSSDAQLFTVSVTVPSGTTSTLNAQPVLVIPAPSNNTCIEVVSASVKCVGGTVPFNNVPLNLQVGSSNSSVFYQMVMSANILSVAAAATTRAKFSEYTGSGAVGMLAPNAPLYLSSQGVVGGGNGYLVVSIMYRLISI